MFTLTQEVEDMDHYESDFNFLQIGNYEDNMLGNNQQPIGVTAAHLACLDTDDSVQAAPESLIKAIQRCLANQNFLTNPNYV